MCIVDGIYVCEGYVGGIETVCFVYFGYVFGVREGYVYALGGVRFGFEGVERDERERRGEKGKRN